MMFAGSYTVNQISGFGLCSSAQVISHFMAAALESNRHLNLKSSIALSRLSSITKLISGFFAICFSFLVNKVSMLCCAQPNQATPDLTPPLPALPRLSSPCLGRPRLFGLSHQCQEATPTDNPEGLFRYLALPFRSAPDHALAHRAAPCRTKPDSLSHQHGTANPHGQGRSPVSIPCLSALSQTKPCPGSPRLTFPVLARPRLVFTVYHSHNNSRQLGGMMPRDNALLIMPLCRLSRRNTWHRRHKTRKLCFSLVASLPLWIWSIWHLFNGKDHSGKSEQYGPWHLPLSLFQTARRVSAHISRGCRLTPMSFGYRERFDFKPAHADGPTICQTDKAASLNNTRLHFIPGHNGFVPHDIECYSPSWRTCKPVSDIPAFGGRIDHAPNIDINRFILVIGAWFNRFNIKRFITRESRIKPVNHNLVVGDNQGGCNQFKNAAPAPLDTSAAFSHGGKNVGGVKKKLTGFVNNASAAPFCGIVAGNSGFFLFLKRQCSRCKLMLQQLTCANDLNFCLNDVAHTSPHSFWVNVKNQYKRYKQGCQDKKYNQCKIIFSAGAE